MTVVLAIKIVSLFGLLFFGSINAVKGARGHSISALNFAFMAASAVGFIWSMGWLS